MYYTIQKFAISFQKESLEFTYIKHGTILTRKQIRSQTLSYDTFTCFTKKIQTNGN